VDFPWSICAMMQKFLMFFIIKLFIPNANHVYKRSVISITKEHSFDHKYFRFKKNLINSYVHFKKFYNLL
jgi:hypothetical protein